MIVKKVAKSDCALIALRRDVSTKTYKMNRVSHRPLDIIRDVEFLSKPSCTQVRSHYKAEISIQNHVMQIVFYFKVDLVLVTRVLTKKTVKFILIE